MSFKYKMHTIFIMTKKRQNISSVFLYWLPDNTLGIFDGIKYVIKTNFVLWDFYIVTKKFKTLYAACILFLLHRIVNEET